MRPYLDGKNNITVRYEWTTEVNRAESEKAGRPIHDKVLMAYIAVVGSKDEFATSVERHFPDGTKKLNQIAIPKLGNTWEAFCKAQEGVEVDTGTPLEAWPVLDVRQVADFKAINIYTVEALAGLNDAGIMKIGPGGRDLVAKAKAYIKAAEDGAAVAKMAGENQRMQEEIDRLKAMVEELAKGKAA